MLQERRTRSLRNIGNQIYIFPTVKSVLLLLLDFKEWSYTEVEYFTVMHECFSLGFTLHKCFGETFSLARNFCFWFSLPSPSLFLWSVPVPFGRHANDTLIIRQSPGNEGIRNELEVSQDSIAFRERSYKRTINILRRSSSNAFFLRLAALGKSCILHIEYFIESAWSLYSIRPGC